MKPPRLPGTEKFRFCDKKFEQFNNIHNNDNTKRQSIIIEDKIVDTAFLLNLSHNSLFDSSSCHTNDNPDQKNNSMDHKKSSYDSVSTTSSMSTLDEILSQMSLNGNGAYNYCNGLRQHYHSKRKPNLPISSRMTSRVFNLTSHIRHMMSDEDHDDDSVVDGEELELELDPVEVDEESDSFQCSLVLADNYNDASSKRYSSKKQPSSAKVASTKKITTDCTKANRSQQVNNDNTINATTLSRSPTPNSLVSSNSDDNASTNESNTTASAGQHHLRTTPSHIIDPHHHLSIAHLHHHSNLHHHRPIMLAAPSHASLMSDDSPSSSSMSLSINTNNSVDCEDSSLRSSSCSPIVEHWAKNSCYSTPSKPINRRIKKRMPNCMVNKNNRFSTLSHSSWEEEEEIENV